jgi:malate dehydrogenase (oxaloacetate-decarboxylating)
MGYKMKGFDDMSKKITTEKILVRANKPTKLALQAHRFYEGKVQVMPKCAITSPKDFAVWYTPWRCSSMQGNSSKPREVL